MIHWLRFHLVEIYLGLGLLKEVGKIVHYKFGIPVTKYIQLHKKCTKEMCLVAKVLKRFYYTYSVGHTRTHRGLLFRRVPQICKLRS